MIGKVLNTLDKKYAFGLLTGLLFGLLGVYTDFFKSNNPKIQFDVLSNTTVVDLKENIGKIDILYDSINILSNKQNLSLITVKISNIGNADVLKNFYDSHFPLGFKVDKGTILEKPALIQSSNDYIRQSIGLTAKSQNEINFTDFIFEKDEFFVLKILVLHDVNTQPELVPEGKIAGVKTINVVKSYLSKESKSFWERVIDGSVLIHVTRFFAYAFSFFLFGLVIILPIGLISNNISTKKRKRKLRRFRMQLGREFTDEEILITNYFLDNGLDAVKRFERIVSQKQKYKRYLEDSTSDLEQELLIRHPERPHDIQIIRLIKVLKEKQYITCQDGNYIMKENLSSFINRFISYMETG